MTTQPLNKYKVSRKGRKLQTSDDQRTLLALPKDIPERTWAEILLKEENDLIIFEIREDILDEALKIGYRNYMKKQEALFTAHCAAQAWLKLIDWFPGKVNVPEELRRALGIVSTASIEDSSGTTSGVSDEVLASESEVLQKITDYSTEELSAKVLMKVTIKW